MEGCTDANVHGRKRAYIELVRMEMGLMKWVKILGIAVFLSAMYLLGSWCGRNVAKKEIAKNVETAVQSSRKIMDSMESWSEMAPQEQETLWNSLTAQEQETLWSSLTAQEQETLWNSLTAQEQETVWNNLAPQEQETFLETKAENWGLGFGKAGEKPRGSATIDEMKKYNAYFMADTEEKILYLTFDCGYENGNTEPILDALKKHDAPATFFVVGHFLETAPELLKRMVEEGHTVGNHSYHHPDMTKITEKASYQEELDAVRDKYKEIVGEEMPMYFRAPQGKYSKECLQMAKDLGYSTFFWSLAYVDWDTNKQPSHADALQKLTERVHPGAIVLLHNTSKTNGEILDELLTKWEEMGYCFGKLEDFTQG